MTHLWSGFDHDPRSPENATLRATDRDRDVVLGVLGDAFADGRLTRDEFDERAEQLSHTRTLGDLPGLLTDLLPSASLRPGTHSSPGVDIAVRATEVFEKERREAAGAFIMASIICWTIWGLTGMGYPWPAWVMFGTGLNVLRVSVQRRQIIDQATKRLERKAEKSRRKELGSSSDPDER